MPVFRCCECSVATFWFLSISENRFLGIANRKINIDARISQLWIPCCGLAVSNFSTSSEQRILGIESTKVEVDARKSLPRFHCCEHSVRFVTLQGFSNRRVLPYRGSDQKDPATSLWHSFPWKLLGASQHRRNVSQGRRKPAKRTLDGQFRPVLEKRGGWEGSEAAGTESIKIFMIDFKKRIGWKIEL